MAGITATGLGSGLDINSLVTQLVQAERTPQQNTIDSQRSSVTSQISALGTLNSALSAMRDALAVLKSGSAFAARTALSSDSTVFTATAGSGAVSGHYDVEVVQLAQAAKLASGAFASSTSAIGSGTLHIDVGGNALDIEIDSGNNTLAGIRDAINHAPTNPGVSATIVTGSSGARLVLTATATGAANTLAVSNSGGDGGLDALSSGMSTITTARDAIVNIDGFAVTSASNTISSAIDGVTLNLAAAKPGTAQTLDIGVDTTAISSALGKFVSAYNKFVATNKQLTSYDPTTNAKGALLGDSTLRGISNGLSRTLGNVYGGSGSISTLSQLGISVQVDGTLSLDSNKLAGAMSAGTEKVAALFTATDGLGATLNAQLAGWLNSGGALDSRTQSLNQRTRQLDTSQAALDARMDSVQARYSAQFNALDTLLSSLNNTSTFLTQQLASLNKSSN